MAEIIVTGAAERRLLADRAIVGATATVVDPVREAAVRRATEQHERLVERARRLVESGDAVRYVADPIATYTNSWRDEHGEPVAEHHASVSVSVELTSLDLVGELTAELAESGADPQVSWGLSPERRRAVTNELRAEAVADARAAAEDYARAIGAARVEIVSLRDGQPGFPGPVPVMRVAMADRAAPEVTVREIEVSAQVEATFAAE